MGNLPDFGDLYDQAVDAATSAPLPLQPEVVAQAIMDVLYPEFELWAAAQEQELQDMTQAFEQMTERADLTNHELTLAYNALQNSQKKRCDLPCSFCQHNLGNR